MPRELARLPNVQYLFSHHRQLIRFMESELEYFCHHVVHNRYLDKKFLLRVLRNHG